MKRVLLLVASLLLLSTLGFAWLRASADYRAGPDGAMEGGGRSVSVSSIAVQQAIGGPAGFAASVSYRNEVGVVQPIPSPAPPSEVSGWGKF